MNPEQYGLDWDTWLTGNAEEIDDHAPSPDWAITFISPIYDAEYHLKGPKYWVMLRKLHKMEFVQPTGTDAKIQ